MTYQPVVPFSGNLGWSFLKRTRESQQAAFDNSGSVVRKLDYFKERARGIGTAEALVADRRLLEVALGAFGLDADINNRFFLKKVLESGNDDPASFANRLSDKRYREMAGAFGFDRTPPNTVLSTFPDQVARLYRSRQFEAAIGNQDENLRLVLGLDRELSALKDRGLSETAAWFTIMGTPPLRRVFEGALGLPPQTGALDIDRQLDIFRTRAIRAFGTSDPLSLSGSEEQETLIRRFLLQAEIAQANQGTSRGAIALALLQPIVANG